MLTLMLQDADKKGLGTIAEEVKQLAQKARDNSLKPADYEVYRAY
jgi:pyruvate dehydrogenase E2 component (dihydrolipoamide acetyltransferase)